MKCFVCWFFWQIYESFVMCSVMYTRKYKHTMLYFVSRFFPFGSSYIQRVCTVLYLGNMQFVMEQPIKVIKVKKIQYQWYKQYIWYQCICEWNIFSDFWNRFQCFIHEHNTQINIYRYFYNVYSRCSIYEIVLLRVEWHSEKFCTCDKCNNLSLHVDMYH